MALFDRLYLNIGAMKAGTTWLYRQLEQHPQIQFSPEKELHYHAYRAGDREALGWKYRVTRAQNAVHRAPGSWHSAPSRHALRWYLPYVLFPPVSDRWYRRRFPSRPGDGVFCADFSNLTAMIGPSGLADIRGLAETVRLTYVLRHPVERVWSHLKFLRQLGTSQSEPRALSRDEILALDQRYGLWQHSQFSVVIDNLQRQFDASEFRLLFYDDIAAHPRDLLVQIEDFLGVGHHDYAEEKLDRRINVSASEPVPALVRDTFSTHMREELLALERLRVVVPAAWHSREDN